MNVKKNVKTDYKPPLSLERPARRRHRGRWRWLGMGFGCLVIGLVMASGREPVASPEAEEVVTPPPAVQHQALLLPAPETTASTPAASAAAAEKPRVRSPATDADSLSVATLATDSAAVNAPEVQAASPEPANREPSSPESDASPEAADPSPPEETESLAWQTFEVRSGDSLAALLARADVSPRTVHELATAGDLGERLSRLHPGDRIRVAFDDDNDELLRLEHRRVPERHLSFRRGEEGFTGQVVETPLERRLHNARATISTSLFMAGDEAGLSDKLIMDLVKIFGWDIDFVLDVRRGDRFTVVHEAFYKDGRYVRDGEIVAAEFVNDGRTHRAVRYTDADGETDYYAPDGTSMRKAFLRNPVEFTRISSGYGRRLHPILGEMRDHHGVDYAARQGTPIRSTGDGRIVFRGRNGGYGNFVVVRHGSRYSTAYGHMSRFARGQRVGSRVSQGETIGYVGSTGLSTGPHLHYEFRVNGRHRDPLKVEFPSVAPIPEDERPRFEARIAPKLTRLDTLIRASADIDR